MRVNRGMECVKMTETVYEPRDMVWIEKGVLGIEWNDGHKAVYPVRYLRQQCPCAACVDEWCGGRGRYRVGSQLQWYAFVGRTRTPRARERVGAPSVDPPRVCRGMGSADVSACRVHAVLRHERRLAYSTVEVGERRTAARVG